jgi:Osmosensitive K+ channel histidine kinase
MGNRNVLWMKWKSYIGITAIILFMTIVLHPLEAAFDMVNIALVFLLPVLLSASLWGFRPALYAAVLSVLAFDFYFIPPTLSFTVADLRYLISFAVYLSVAAITASLSSRLKHQLLLSKQREAHTAVLYELSRELGAVTDLQSLIDSVSLQVSKSIGSDIAVFLPDEQNRLKLYLPSNAASNWGQREEGQAIARLVLNHNEAAGFGTETLRDDPGQYAPLRADNRTYGVLAVNLGGRTAVFGPEQQRLLEALTDLTASTIARMKLMEEARIAHLTAESERLRTAILDSVSHELRTPLATIIGSASSLIEGDRLFSGEDRMELLQTIREGALRMNRLVQNLLGMVQLESGMLKLKRNWCDVEDLIGVALAQVKEFQQHRQIRVKLPDEVPLLVGDEVLLEQMLVNVVSNAIKYSPDSSVIDILARAAGDRLILTVADQGVGLEEIEYERIFDKFYRAKASNNVTGTGLGLAICRGIAELHGGTISASPNEPQGTVITIALPLPTREDSNPSKIES